VGFRQVLGSVVRLALLRCLGNEEARRVGLGEAWWEKQVKKEKSDGKLEFVLFVGGGCCREIL